MGRTKPTYGPKKPLWQHVQIPKDSDLLVPNNQASSAKADGGRKVSKPYKFNSIGPLPKFLVKRLEVMDKKPFTPRESAERSVNIDVDGVAATLANPTSKTTEELYLALAKSAETLSSLQKEYANINKAILRFKGDETLHDIWHEKKPNPRTRPEYWKKLDPQYLIDDYDRSERKKEADLYGYKYKKGPNEDGQDPWFQGGFVPHALALDSIRGKYGDALENYDNFPTSNLRGVTTAPRRPIPKPGGLRRRERRILEEAAPVPTGPRATRGKKRKYDFESEETQTTGNTDTDAGNNNDNTNDNTNTNSNAGASVTIQDDKPGKMVTRYRGARKPPTRSASATPNPQPSQIQTASPAPKRARIQKTATTSTTSTADRPSQSTLETKQGGGAKKSATTTDASTTATTAVTRGATKSGNQKQNQKEKNPNRSEGMKASWARRKEKKKPKKSSKKVNGKAQRIPDDMMNNNNNNNTTTAT